MSSISRNSPIESKQQLIDYIASGSKPKSEWSIGTEHEKFVYCLENSEGSIARAGKVFGIDQSPEVDHEPLILKTEKYGTIHFTKVATYYKNINKFGPSWLVFLNINASDKLSQLMDDIMDFIKASQ